MPRRRLIFLDIDGVICCNSSGQLEPAKLSELQRIVRLTGAKIVLSTALDSWFQMVSNGELMGRVSALRARSAQVAQAKGSQSALRPILTPRAPSRRVSHSEPIGLAAPARAEGKGTRCAPTGRHRLCWRDAAACNVPAGTPTVLTCSLPVPLRRRAAHSGPHSRRVCLGRDVPYVSCTLPPQIRPTEITDWLKASGRGVTGCGPPYGPSSPALPPHA